MIKCTLICSKAYCQEVTPDFSRHCDIQQWAILLRTNNLSQSIPEQTEKHVYLHFSQKCMQIRAGKDAMIDNIWRKLGWSSLLLVHSPMNFQILMDDI